MNPKLDSVYITYWSLQNPLCQAQSLPYLRALTRFGYRIGLITFEQAPWLLTSQEKDERRQELASEGIEWHPLRYHKRPPVLSTLFDIGIGTFVAAGLARSSEASLIHGRSSVSNAMATLAAKLTGKRLFVDADGPLSQEKVDAGVWKKGSIGDRLTEWGERKALQAGDVIAVLTSHRERQVAQFVAGAPVYVLPCAVDLERFRPDTAGRKQTRAQLGLEGTVLVYAGKAGGWYDIDELVAFVSEARSVFGSLTLLVLTADDPAPFVTACKREQVPLCIRPVHPPEMPKYLSAADVGVCFLRPFPSKLSCSPIKLGEYLACGLPVVSTSGCGDYDDLIESESVGSVVTHGRRETYRKASEQLANLLEDPNIRQRCRDAARRRVGLDEVVVPRYAEIYQTLVGSAWSGQSGPGRGER